jgi:hypothetical protein
MEHADLATRKAATVARSIPETETTLEVTRLEGSAAVTSAIAKDAGAVSSMAP